MSKESARLRREVLEIAGAFAIAWVAYQLLAAATGTPLPIVSVVSDSMYHTTYFDSWWGSRGSYYEEQGISREQFMRFPAPNGLSRGDLLVVVKAESPQRGDILIYRKFGSDFTIVHRLIRTEDSSYITKGDNNPLADQPVSKQYVVGKVVFAVPVLGYPRLVLHAFGI